jgi:hypothetical protein
MELTDFRYVPRLAMGNYSICGFQEGMPSCSQDAGSFSTPEGKAGNLDGMEAILKASFAGRKQALQAGIENCPPSELTFKEK